MAIKYKLFQITKEGSTNFGKWRARVVPTGTVNLDQLAEHMHSHNSAYSAGVIRGVLTDMVTCIIELVASGNCVDIEGFGRFKAKICCTGSEKMEDFALSRNIKDVKLACRPKKTFHTQYLTYGRYKGQLTSTPLKVQEITQNANTLGKAAANK
ncbi:MAG: DNA-binding protein [Prevotella sp.]|jgi:predicted histone-like DNA-binding protein